MLGYLLAPLFLIVPLMVSAVLAADAFAGEKERKTLESLLHLPISDAELFYAKLLTAFIPAMVVSWVGFLCFSLVSNTVAWPVLHRVFVPTGLWLVLILWMAPAVAALGLAVMVRVSARARTSQEANQLGGAVILPLIFLAVGQSSGLLLVPIEIAIAFGAVLWIVALVLIRGGAKRFTRDQLSARTSGLGDRQPAGSSLVGARQSRSPPGESGSGAFPSHSPVHLRAARGNRAPGFSGGCGGRGSAGDPCLGGGRLRRTRPEMSAGCRPHLIAEEVAAGDRRGSEHEEELERGGAEDEGEEDAEHERGARPHAVVALVVRVTGAPASAAVVGGRGEDDLGADGEAELLGGRPLAEADRQHPVAVDDQADLARGDALVGG